MSLPVGVVQQHDIENIGIDIKIETAQKLVEADRKTLFFSKGMKTKVFIL